MSSSFKPLIVDDEPMLLNLLQQMLAPHTSTTVGTYQDACFARDISR